MNNMHKKININKGIQILRMILCLWVLSFHYLNRKKLNYFFFCFFKTKFFHVPCFSFITFYYSYNIFSKGKFSKFKARLERLLIPYLIWPLLVFIKNNISNEHKKFSLIHLKNQIIFGSKFIVPLWYLFSIIIITIFFYILSKLFIKYFLFIAQLLMIISYVFLYSHSYIFLFNYKDYVRFSLLGTLGIFPICISALLIASLKIIEKLQLYRKISLFYSFLSIYILFKYDLFVVLKGYKGIMNNLAAIFFFLGFYLLPLETLSSNIEKIIIIITNYTQGIYCLHSEMIPFVRRNFDFEGTFKGCIIIYLISYFISFIGTKLLWKTKFRFLFI